MVLAALIAANTVLCTGVLAAIVGPLVWAILTQDRDVETVVAQRRRRAQIATRRTRPAPRPSFTPISWPA